MATDKKIKGYKTIYIDVMLKDKFICQIPYEYCPLFKLTQEELIQHVIKNRPYLANKKFTVSISQNRVI